MAMATVVALWSTSAQACGTGAVAMAMKLIPGLGVVFLLSLISAFSLRAASKAFGRMHDRSPSGGLRWARWSCLVGVGISILGAALSGGLLLSLVVRISGAALI